MQKSSFGEVVKGFDIPVFNEREIRAAAGLLFLFAFIGVQRVIYTWDFSIIKVMSLFFWGDFLIRIFISPRYSPSLILGRWIVRNQTPEYVGAEQKKFAWSIGLGLGTIMVISFFIMNIHTPITGIICLICQIFLFFEAAFGICLGCFFYPYVYGKRPKLCPGEVCDPDMKQEIQFVKKTQWLAFIGYMSIFILLLFVLSDVYRKEPRFLLGVEKPPEQNLEAPPSNE